MKSTFRGALVGLAVMLGAQTAYAQTMSFGVGGGAVVPTGALGDGLGTGWSGTALVRVQPAASRDNHRIVRLASSIGASGTVDRSNCGVRGTAHGT